MTTPLSLASAKRLVTAQKPRSRGRSQGNFGLASGCRGRGAYGAVAVAMTLRTRSKTGREHTPSSWKARSAGSSPGSSAAASPPHSALAGPPARAVADLDAGEPGSGQSSPEVDPPQPFGQPFIPPGQRLPAGQHRPPARGQDSGDLPVGSIGLRGEMDRIDAQHGIGRIGVQSGRGQVADAELRRDAQPRRLLTGLAHRLSGEVHAPQPGRLVDKRCGGRPRWRRWIASLTGDPAMSAYQLSKYSASEPGSGST